jgi:hypothetical protein
LRGFVDLVVCECEVDLAGFTAHVRGGRVFEEVRHVDGGECEECVGVALVGSCAGEQREEGESSHNDAAHFERGTQFGYGEGMLLLFAMMAWSRI